MGDKQSHTATPAFNNAQQRPPTSNTCLPFPSLPPFPYQHYFPPVAFSQMASRHASDAKAWHRMGAMQNLHGTT